MPKSVSVVKLFFSFLDGYFGAFAMGIAVTMVELTVDVLGSACYYLLQRFLFLLPSPKFVKVWIEMYVFYLIILSRIKY